MELTTTPTLQNEATLLFKDYFDSIKGNPLALGIPTEDLCSKIEELIPSTNSINDLVGNENFRINFDSNPKGKPNYMGIEGHGNSLVVTLNRSYNGINTHKSEDEKYSLFAIYKLFQDAGYDISIAASEIARNQDSSLNQLEIRVNRDGRELFEPIRETFDMKKRNKVVPFVYKILDDVVSHLSGNKEPNRQYLIDKMREDERREEYGIVFANETPLKDDEFSIEFKDCGFSVWYMRETEDGRKEWSDNFFHYSYKPDTIRDVPTFRYKIGEAIYNLLHDSGSTDHKLMIGKIIMDNMEKFNHACKPNKV